MTTIPGDSTVKTLRPAPRRPGLGFGELWDKRHVLFVLAQRDFKIRYANLALGVVWVILEPLLLTMIIAFMLGLIMGRGEQLGLPFAVFLFTGWVAYRPFSRMIGIGGASIRANGPLVDRIYLPRAYFPISVGMVTLVDLAAMIVVTLGLGFVFGITPGPGMLMLPALVLVLYAFSLGGAFFFSAVSLIYPDLDMVKMLILRAWFWLSPIIYPTTQIPEELRNFYYLNPLVLVIDGFRWAFARTPAPPPEEWIIGSCSAAVILVVGYLIFRKREPFFADEM